MVLLKDINHLFAPDSFECNNNIFVFHLIISIEGKAFFLFSCYIELDEIKCDILQFDRSSPAENTSPAKLTTEHKLFLENLR